MIASNPETKSVLLLMRNSLVALKLEAELGALDPHGLIVVPQLNDAEGLGRLSENFSWDFIVVDPVSRDLQDSEDLIEHVYTQRCEHSPNAKIIILSDFKNSLRIPIDREAWRFLSTRESNNEESQHLLWIMQNDLTRFPKRQNFTFGTGGLL